MGVEETCGLTPVPLKGSAARMGFQGPRCTEALLKRTWLLFGEGKGLLLHAVIAANGKGHN